MADMTILVGQSVELKAKETRGALVRPNVVFTWTSSAPAVLELSSTTWYSTTAIGRSVGTAIVTAESGGLADTFTVDVVNPTALAIERFG
jgi:hypothetical protein